MTQMSEAEGEGRHPLLALEGRVGRARYLAFVIGAYVVYCVCEPLSGLLLASRSSWQDGAPHVSHLLALLVGGAALIVIIVLLFVSISFATRRFHDMNLRGNWNWLIIIVFSLPSPHLPNVNVPWLYVPPVGFLVWHAFLGLIPGTRGRNRYGPAPGQPDNADLVAVFDTPSPDRAPRA